MKTLKLLLLLLIFTLKTFAQLPSKKEKLKERGISYTYKEFGKRKDQNYGLINAKGQVIIEPKYDKVGFLKNGNIYGQKGLHQFTLNTKGKILDKEFKPKIIKNVFFGLIISLMIGLTIYVFKTK